MLNDTITLKNLSQFFIKLNIYLFCNSSVPLVGVYPKERDTSTKRLMNIHSSLIHNCPKLEKA